MCQSRARDVEPIDSLAPSFGWRECLIVSPGELDPNHFLSDLELPGRVIHHCGREVQECGDRAQVREPGPDLPAVQQGMLELDIHSAFAEGMEDCVNESEGLFSAQIPKRNAGDDEIRFLCSAFA